MEGKGSLALDLVDVYGDHLHDRFDLFLKHTAPTFKNQGASKEDIMDN